MHSVSIVNYTNSWPFYEGLQILKQKKLITLSADNPHECARKLLAGEVHLGLVPVAILPTLKNYQLISNLGIAAFGHVGSVFLFSNVPLNEIKRVFLDYQSRTSVKLLQVLLKFFWRKDVEFLHAKPGFEEQIEGPTAGLIIGDRAFTAMNDFPYKYDLATAWTSYTGLPFVFAVWAGTTTFSDEFLQQFNGALLAGLDKRNEIIRERAVDYLHAEMLHNYLFNSILYFIGPEEKIGMELFLTLEKKL